MSKAQISPEMPIPHYYLGELDPSLFKPTPEEWAFLRSTISSDDQEITKRVLAVQSEAYAAYPYPCIRWFHYTNLMMSTNSIYPVILEKAQENSDVVFLDLGCCMGTEIRKLAQDGFPASQIVGCDLRREYIDAGYKLYGDRASCDITFFADDIFEVNLESTPSAKPPSLSLKDATSLMDLQGRVSYIYAGALFHIFDKETQRALAARVASLLRVPSGASLGDAPVDGCVIFGTQQGKKVPGPVLVPVPPGASLGDAPVNGSQQGNKVPGALDGKTRFGHNLETWNDMWHDVLEERYGRDFVTNRVQVKAEYRDVDYGWGPAEWLLWSVKIV